MLSGRQSLDQYSTPGYVSSSIVNFNHRDHVIREGESQTYAKNRDAIEKRKMMYPKKASNIFSWRNDKPVIPNRLATLDA